jgi:UDP-glucose 4-epimerase
MNLKSESIFNSTICITGGTGSFGSTMAKYCLVKGAKEVRIFSRDENKQDSLRSQLSDDRVKFIIGDVRNPISVESAMADVDYVFHAAALKQVPSCEFFPEEAVATNIIGSENVIRGAVAQGVKSVVCLSTDKAVYPINAMGISKAMMEKIAQSRSRLAPENTKILITRYGNVMMSRGSVIPLFIEQLKNSGKVTVTNPRMTRFMMSLQDSVNLVDYAFSSTDSGSIFVRKAPACTIEVLVKAIASMLGIKDPEMQIIGTRHGEKMHEHLLSSEEMLKAIDEGEYFRIPIDERGLDYSTYFSKGQASGASIGNETFSSENTKRLSLDETVGLLESLPEFRRA